MARPTKYTPAVVDLICGSIKVGATYVLAAKAAGISYETFREWRETKPAFSALIEKAEGEAAVGWLGKIERAANAGSWTAAAWKLERRYPHDYGRQVFEHQGRDGGPVEFTITIAGQHGDSDPEAD
jgi:transposase